jgi:hypothetical protein
MAEQPVPPPEGQILLYQTEDGRTRLEPRFAGDTLWLSLNQMADLFQRDKSVISRHVNKIFAEGELSRQATVAQFATVQTEGERSEYATYRAEQAALPSRAERDFEDALKHLPAKPRRRDPGKK